MTDNHKLYSKDSVVSRSMVKSARMKMNHLRPMGCLCALAVTSFLWLSACASPSAQPKVTIEAPALNGGVLATFDVVGEQFKAWVTNPATAQQIIDLRDGKSEANIPAGRILHGPGEASHNVPYSWHLDPEDIVMAEFTIEVCDARPSSVETNVDEFVDNVKQYCPWSAKLVSVQDLRGLEFV